MRAGGAPGGSVGGDGSGAAGIPWLCLTGGGVKPKNKEMLRLIAPLLLLLQAFAAMAPVGGVELCLGIPGGRDATPAETSCGCGHHAEDPKSDLPAAPDEPGAPLDSEVCVDLELVAEEALPVDLEVATPRDGPGPSLIGGAPGNPLARSPSVSAPVPAVSFEVPAP